MKKMNYTKRWKEMEDKIKEQSKHAEDYWFFSCLRDATTLTWDIGEEVYYTEAGFVRKGIIISVNQHGVCYVTKIPYNCEEYQRSITSDKLYKNVSYALMELAAAGE